MHYTVHMLHDGTVLSAYPKRKPSRRILKRDRIRIDPDGVVVEWGGAGRELSDIDNDTRCRFQDLIAANLNSRRAIRALVLPRLAEILEEVQALRQQVERMGSLASGTPTVPTRE